MHSFKSRGYGLTLLALSQVVIGSCYSNITNMYVVNSFDTTVSVIDATTQQVVNSLQGFDGPTAVAWDGSTGMYVANNGSMPGSIFVIDTITNNISQVVGNFNNPFGLASDGWTGMYVSNQGDGTVSVIDTQTGAVAAVVSMTGAMPGGLAWDGGAGMYVIDTANPTVYVIDVRTLGVSQSISLPFTPNDVAYDGVTGMYVCENGANVAVINTQTHTLSDLLTVADGAFTLGWDGATGMYVTDGFSVVNIIDTQTLQPAWSAINVGNAPQGLAWDGNRGMYVGESSASNVSVIDTRTFEVVNAIGVGASPLGIARAVIPPADAKPLLLVVELKNIAQAACQVPAGEPIELFGKPIPDISELGPVKILVMMDNTVMATVTVNLLAGSAFSDNPSVYPFIFQDLDAGVLTLTIEMISSV